MGSESDPAVPGAKEPTVKIKPRYAILAAISSATVAVAVVNRGAIGTSFENLAQDAMEASMDLPVDPTYGPEPRFADCKKDAQGYMQNTLLDYDSAKIEWESAELEKGAFEFDDAEYRSIRYLTVLVNAKNKFGAYTGQRRWAFGWEGEDFVGVSIDGGFEWTKIQ
jgi:hypothetical protein